MKWIKYFCICCVFTATACDNGSIEKKSNNADQKVNESKKALAEIDAGLALWYSYQDEAFIAARPILNKDFGSVHHGRDPSEILVLQREVFKALRSQVDARTPESEAILKRWLICQAEAADCLVALLGKNTQDKEGIDTVKLLDIQDETISLLKNELQRRGQKYWSVGPGN